MDETKEIVKAVEQFVATRTIPILWDEGEGTDINQIGTGTLFKIKDRLFLITARHVVAEDGNKLTDLTRLAIPLSPRETDVQTLGHCTVILPDDENVDIAIFELIDRALLSAMSDWQYLTLDDTAPASPQGTFVLCGFPSEKLSKADGLLRGALLISYTSRIEQAPENATQPVDPNLDLFFIHDRHSEDFDGKVSDSFDLKGTSGCSIWEYRDPGEGFWMPGKVLKIVGVQSTARHGEYSRAKNWEYVKGILFKHDPDIFSD